MRLAAVIAVAVVAKLVLAIVASSWTFWAAESFAETWMGARGVDGAALGVLYAMAIALAFAATSALAAAFAGPCRVALAAGATALLFAVTASVMLVTWLRTSDEFRYGPRAIVENSYVKYPPWEAAARLQDRVTPTGIIVLPADIAMTLIIALLPGRRRRRISTTDTLRASI